MKQPQTVKVGEPLIVAHGLTLGLPFGVSYGNVDLSIPRGCVCAIVAENNQGKTELLLSLAGRMKPWGGTLEVAGYSLPRRRAKVRRMSGMGFFDRVNEVQPVLSVKNVAAAELNLYSLRSGRRATEAFLKEWGLDSVAKQKVESLDRFTYVRLGIALGMVGDPLILVVDDIESDLTRHQSLKLMEELKDIAHNRAMTVVVACTDYDLALSADMAVPVSESAREQARAVHEKMNGFVPDGALARELNEAVDCPAVQLRERGVAASDETSSVTGASHAPVSDEDKGEVATHA